MGILRSKYFLLVGIGIAVFLPFSLLTIPVSSSWWTTYISWVAFFMQSFLMVTAGALMYRAAFHRRVLGGLIGTGLRIFSLGLLFLGIGLSQIPFIQAYMLWNTPYVVGGFYFIPYFIGTGCILVSLLIARWSAVLELVNIIGIVTLLGLFIWLLLARLPLHPNTFFTTLPAYYRGITIDAALFSIVVGCILFSFVHARTTNNMRVEKIYRLQTFAFSWYLIPLTSDFLLETVPGWSTWYTYSLGGIALFAGSLLLAAIYFYRLGLFVYEIKP